MGESRKAGTPLGQQLAVGRERAFRRTSSLRLRTTSLRPGQEEGLLRSATRSVGCFPVTRTRHSKRTDGRGVCSTGPGPLAGGMNKRLYAYHPTLALARNWVACPEPSLKSSSSRPGKPRRRDAREVSAYSGHRVLLCDKSRQLLRTRFIPISYQGTSAARNAHASVHPESRAPTVERMSPWVQRRR